LRQAYDYWQNQPGNYRSPGLATGACFSAGEISKLLVSTTGGAPPTAPSAGPTTPLTAFRFPPLSSPKHPSTALNPLWAVWLRCLRRRTYRAPSAIRRQVHGVTPRCSYGRSSQRPNTHRAQPATPTAEAANITRHPQYAATDFVGDDTHYVTPASETGACKPVQRSTQWVSIR
jgi:hypothetical protein